MSKKRQKSARIGGAAKGGDDSAPNELSLLSDDSWQCHLALVHSAQYYAEKYSHEALALARRGVRPRFMVISYATMKAEADELAKAKGKAKNADIQARAEQLSVLSAALESDADGEVASAMAAVIRAMLQQRKTQFLTARDAEGEGRLAAESGESTVAAGRVSKTPKRGTKPANSPSSAPGKRAASMKTRAEELAHVDVTADEPENGPRLYCLLEGFHDPQLLPALATQGIPIQTVVQVTSDDDDAPDEQPPASTEADTASEGLADPTAFIPPPRADAVLNFVSHARQLVRQADEASVLRDIAWQELAVGQHPDAAATFDSMAHLLYKLLDLFQDYRVFSSSLELVTVPAVRGPIDTRLYDQLVDRLSPRDRVVPVLLDCMLQHVAATVEHTEAPVSLAKRLISDMESEPRSASGERPRSKSSQRSVSATSRPTTGAVEARNARSAMEAARRLVEQQLDTLMAPFDELDQDEGVDTGSTEPLIIRHNDEVLQTLSSDLPHSEYAPLSGARRIFQAALAHQLSESITERAVLSQMERDFFFQQLLEHSSLTRSESEVIMHHLKFAQLLAHATERYDAQTTQQVLHDATAGSTQRLLTRYDPNLHAMVACVVSEATLPNAQWSSFAPGPVGFSDYLEHVRSVIGGGPPYNMTPACNVRHPVLSVTGNCEAAAYNDVVLQRNTYHFYDQPQRVRLLLEHATLPCQAFLTAYPEALLPGEDETPQTSLRVVFGNTAMVLDRHTLRRCATRGKCDWVPPSAPTGITEPANSDGVTPTPADDKRQRSGGPRPRSSTKNKRAPKPSGGTVTPAAPAGEDAPATTEETAVVSVFEPVDPATILAASVLVSDRLNVHLSPNGAITLVDHATSVGVEQSSFGVQAERYRSYLPGGTVVRVLLSGDVEVLHADGRSWYLKGGEWRMKSFEGQCVRYDAHGVEIETIDLATVSMHSVPEGVEVLGREDGAVLVRPTSDSHALEFPDGTQFHRDMHGRLRICFAGLPDVVQMEDAVQLLVVEDDLTLTHRYHAGELIAESDYCTVSITATGEARFDWQGQEASLNLFTGEAACLEDGEEMAQIATFEAVDAHSTGHANAGAADARESVLPSLFVLYPDGSSVQYLRNLEQELEELVEADDHIELIRHRLASDSTSESVTLIQREEWPPNPHKALPSIIPPSLQRHGGPVKNPQSKQALLLRQFVKHEAVTAEKLQQLGSALMAARQAKKEQEAQVAAVTLRDQRRSSTAAQAAALRAQVMQKLVTLQDQEIEAAWDELKQDEDQDADSLAGSPKLESRDKAEPAAAPPNIRRGLSVRELMKDAAQPTIPGYFSSPEGSQVAADISARRRAARLAEVEAQRAQTRAVQEALAQGQASAPPKSKPQGAGGVNQKNPTPASIGESQVPAAAAASATITAAPSPPRTPKSAPVGAALIPEATNDLFLAGPQEEPSRRPTQDPHSLGQPRFRDIHSATVDSAQVLGAEVPGPGSLRSTLRGESESTPRGGALSTDEAIADAEASAATTLVGTPLQTSQDQIEFGCLKEDSAYCMAFRIENTGTEARQFSVTPVTDDRLLVLAPFTKVEPGAAVRCEVQVNATRAGDLDTALVLVDAAGGELRLPLSASILSKQAFEHQRLSARHRGKGVRLLSTRPLSSR